MIDSMTPNDAVNEGLLANLIARLEADAKVGCYTLIKYEHKELLAALRAVPSPDIVGVRLPEIPDDDADFTPELARKIIAIYQKMLASPIPCTSARREEIDDLRPELEQEIQQSVYGNKGPFSIVDDRIKYI